MRPDEYTVSDVLRAVHIPLDRLAAENVQSEG
jgi:hypothetical protein